MEWAGIISRSTGSPWAALRRFWALNIRTITDSYVIPNLHSLNFQLKGKPVFSQIDKICVGYFSKINGPNFGRFGFCFCLPGLYFD